MRAAARQPLCPTRCLVVSVGDDASIVPPAPPPDKVRVGVGVPDDPPLDTRRTPKKTCHCEPARRLVWQSVIPLHRTPDTWENGFPRRCAPRNDICMEIILSRVGAGFYPARPCAAEWGNGRGRAAAPTNVLQFFRRAAPMCAAADYRRTPSGGAHCPALQVFCRGRCPHRPECIAPTTMRS